MSSAGAPTPKPTPTTPTPPAAWLAVKPFIFGAVAGCTATCSIQPLDMVKVRLQLSGEGGVGKVIKSPFEMARVIHAESGVLGFYRGLSAGLLRQCTYGMARFGLYRTFTDMLADPETKKVSAYSSAGAGLAAGGLGAFLGTPADLVLIRMQGDRTLPEAQRRNYKGVFDALTQIVRKEGVPALWSGCLPTVTRAMAMNLGMLSTYDEAKKLIRAQTSQEWLVIGAGSMVAGFFGSAAALPFDFVKTRMQKQKVGADGKLPYSSSLDCVVKTVRSEGPLAFYKGFVTFFFRIGPHTVISLPVLDALNAFAKKNGF